MHQDQTVFEMAQEVLERQLRELRDGPHRDEKATEWQASLLWQRIKERHYSWLEGYME